MARYTTFKSSLLIAAAVGCLALSPFTAGSALAVDLKEALESTYETNPILDSERRLLATVDERVAQAISEWRPTVNAEASTGRQRVAFGGAAANHSTEENLSLQVEQPVFNSGGSVARLGSAKYQVRAGRERLRASEQDVLLQAITAYMDVVRDQAVLELSENNVGVLDKQLKASKDRFDVGEVTRTDVAQSDARRSRSVSEQAQAQGALESSKAAFKRMTGIDAVGLVNPTAIPQLPTNQDEATQIALDQSPTLKRAKYTEEALDKEIWSSKSRLLPSVALRGLMSRQSGAGTFGNSDYDDDSVTVNLSVPLYQAGADHSRVREAKQNYKKSTFDTKDAHDSVIERLTRAWQTLETSRASIKANKDSIDAAEIALDGVKQEQQYGARTVLDVLDAEQELFAARVNLVRSQRNELVAAYTVLSVLGWLTPERLALDVKVYNPEENYDRVKYLPFGF